MMVCSETCYETVLTQLVWGLFFFPEHWAHSPWVVAALSKDNVINVLKARKYMAFLLYGLYFM